MKIKRKSRSWFFIRTTGFKIYQLLTFYLCKEMFPVNDSCDLDSWERKKFNGVGSQHEVEFVGVAGFSKSLFDNLSAQQIDIEPF